MTRPLLRGLKRVLRDLHFSKSHAIALSALGAVTLVACSSGPDGTATPGQGSAVVTDDSALGARAALPHGKQELSGYVTRPALKAAPIVDVVSASEPIHLTVSLPLRDRARLEALAEAVSDPQNPAYRQYLTAEQFAERHAPTPADYQAVQAWAQASHLTVTDTTSNRLVMDLGGTAADVERALHVNLVYAQRADGSRFFKSANEPSLDLETTVERITGLDNYDQPRSHGGSINYGGVSGGYGSSDIRKAYVPGCTGLSGSGQTVGIVAFDGYNLTDVFTYMDANDFPPRDMAFPKILFGAATGLPAGNSVETVADVEMAMAMAPYLYELVTFIGPNAAQSTNPCSFWPSMMAKAATYTNILQFSTSFTCWGDVSASLTTMQAQGQTFFFPAGDSGGMSSNEQWPDQPGMTVVGATSLTMNGAGASYASEIPWVDPGHSMGTGGGSEYEIAIPSYQSGLATTANGASSLYRNIPDVAIVGARVFVVGTDPTPNTSFTFEGTSASTPLWAGFMALVNQQAAANAAPPVGFINPALYALAKSSAYSANFHDVTTGQTTSYQGGATHNAVAGYDLTSGWGTPTCGLASQLACSNKCGAVCGRATPCPAGQIWDSGSCACVATHRIIFCPHCPVYL